MLMGWEVKSIRDGKVQLAEAYVQLRKGKPSSLAVTSRRCSASTTWSQSRNGCAIVTACQGLAQLFSASQQKAIPSYVGDVLEG